LAGGAFAEYARAREDNVAPKPTNLTFEQAAVVAVSGLPALQALRDHGKVEPGPTVLSSVRLEGSGPTPCRWPSGSGQR
jgi:NADPH:quinone reductase-like Zn-dependent oxidoreductase